MSARSSVRIARVARAMVVTLVAAGCSTPPAMAVSAWGTGATLPEPGRPDVPAWLDRNDPVSFIGLGVDMLRRGRADSAAAAFYWASRIDPALATPYYGRSVALLLTYRRPMRYVYGDNVWLPAAKIPGWRLAIVDSLRTEALARDPFQRAIYDHLLTGRPPLHALDDVSDPAVRGYWMYDFGYMRLADSLLGVAVKAKPKQWYLRELRARAEYSLGRYDSAAAQLHVLLDTLSHRDSTKLTLAYSSKELIYLALGNIEAERNDTAAARTAFENAIDENAAFYPAHARLAALAMARHDVPAAIGELSRAIEAAPDDPTMLLLHAAALLDNGDAARAATELLKVIELDPYYAKPYLLLARAYEARGYTELAAQAYAKYAAHERGGVPRRAWAEAYADTLRGRLAKPR